MTKQELNKMISFNKETNAIELNIPKDLDINLILKNDLKGSIRTANVWGYIDVANVGGYIDTRNVKGYIDTENVEGNIRTFNVEGNIRTFNVEGNIDTRNVKGYINTFKVGGNIRTSNVGGNIRTSNVGGYIDTLDVRGNIDVANVWGYIDTENVEGNIRTDGKSRLNNKWYDNIWKDDIRTEYTKKRTINGLDIYHLINSGYKFLIVDKTLNLSAHGETLKECKESLKYKIKNFKKDKKPIIDKIKKAGRLSREDYRKLTGACEAGVKEFCKENKITTKTISINKLLKIFKDKNYYGSEEFGKWFKESE